MVVTEEKAVRLTPFSAFPSSRLINESEARDELTRTCGRFRSVLPRDERMLAILRDRLSSHGVDAAYRRVPGVPLQWRALLEYLYAEKLIAKPAFYAPLIDNSHPKTFELSLTPHADADETDARVSKYAAYANGRDIEHVMERVVGELLERRLLRRYRRRNLLHATSESMSASGRGLDTAKLPGFAAFQHAAVPLGARDERAPLLWERGFALQTGKRFYLPAQLVYWSYAQGKDGERVLGDSTTSGCAGHFTRDGAFLSALLELVERDGFLIYWLNGLAPRVIDMERSPDPALRRYLAYLARYRLTSHFLDTTTDIGIPSICCVVTDELDASRVGVGNAAGFDLAHMAIHAAEEALAAHRAESVTAAELPHDYRPFLDTSITLARRRALWRSAQMRPKLDFFLRGARISPEGFMEPALRVPSSTSAKLSHIIDTLARRGEGYEAYGYEVRDPVLERLGYHVVRALVPALMPLYLREHLATLDAKRLFEVPRKLGFEPAKVLNPVPHPFL